MKKTYCLTEAQSDKFFAYIARIRESGVTDIGEVRDLLVDRFDIEDAAFARYVLAQWMKSYDEKAA